MLICKVQLLLSTNQKSFNWSDNSEEKTDWIVTEWFFFINLPPTTFMALYEHITYRLQRYTYLF